MNLCQRNKNIQTNPSHPSLKIEAKAENEPLAKDEESRQRRGREQPPRRPRQGRGWGREDKIRRDKGRRGQPPQGTGNHCLGP